MTTIIGNLDGLYADSQISDGDQRWSVIKIERIDGCLYGTAGDAAEGEGFYAWIRRKKRGKKPVVTGDFCALALTPKGLFFYDAALYPLPLQHAHAIGSGAKAARGALLAGADVVRAVEIACEVDANSAPPVQIFRLNESQP